MFRYTKHVGVGTFVYYIHVHEGTIMYVDMQWDRCVMWIWDRRVFVRMVYICLHVEFSNMCMCVMKVLCH